MLSRNKKKHILFMTVISFLILKFWVGIYEHDEFFHKSIFMKHRPIWKTFFYSPTGMGEYKLDEMSNDERKEQEYFDEFILGKVEL